MARKNVKELEIKKPKPKKIADIKVTERYTVTQKLGQGGMADVYKAIDHYCNDRIVAIKILKDIHVGDEAHLNRFQREVNAITRVNSVYSVKVYDYLDIEGRPAIVMEFVPDHDTLKDIVKKEGSLIEDRAVNIIKSTLKALVDIHNIDVIHRDIKPQNILVTADGTTKLCDFGIAIYPDSLELTKTNEVVGSVQYLAPEVVDGQAPSFQSDIYALGIVLYEALTGELPFNGKTPIEVALKHVNEDMPSVRTVNSDLSKGLETVIFKATSKKKEDRYKTASQMLIDLENYDDEFFVHHRDEIMEETAAYRFQDEIELSEYKTGKKERRILLIMFTILLTASIMIVVYLTWQILL